MQFILHADDFGRTETVNESITYGFKNGYLSRTTIMVNMPYYQEAKGLARDYGFYDKIGLHINIVCGDPLTEPIKSCPNFTNKNGKFNGRFFQNKRLWFFLSIKEKKALYLEIEAQIKRYLEDGFTLLHADSHGHTHTFPAINKIVIKLLKKYRFKSVRVTRNVGLKPGQKLYKLIMDNRNRWFNRVRHSVVEHFGSCSDVMRNYDALRGLCEVMMHPNIYNDIMLVEEEVTYQLLYDFIQSRGGVIL